MKKITILIGVPAAGKSTLAKTMRKDNVSYISSDELRNKRFGESFSEEIKKNIYLEIEEKTKEFFRNEITNECIIDSTYLNEIKIREEFIEFMIRGLEPQNIELLFINVNTDLDIAIERDSKRIGGEKVGKEVIDSIYKNLTFVSQREIKSLSEIFKKVSYYNTNGPVIKLKISQKEDETINYLKKEAVELYNKYLNKEITGTQLSNLMFEGELEFEEFYIQDLQKNDSFPLAYYNGIILDISYDKIYIGENLDSSKIIVREISLTQ